MRLLKDLLVKKKTNIPGSIDDKTIFYVFRKVMLDEFGNIGADKFLARHFEKNKIFVETESSAWASELWLNRSRIIEKINKELGQNLIREIKVN